MCTFHGRLLVADGSPSGLRVWDGVASQAAFIEGSPPKPTLVDSVANRVAVNSAGDLDAVYLSAPYDETNWDLNGQAAAVRCGYMDGLEVVAWAVLGGTSLIVSKRGAQADMLYRFDLAGLTSDWQVSQPLTRSHAALHGRAMVQAGNEVYFFDRFGLCSLRGVLEFGTVKGEVQVDPLMGGRINPMLAASALTDVSHMAYLPELGAVAAAMKGSSLIVLWHVAGQAFTTLDLGLTVQAFATGRDPLGGVATRLAAGDAVYELATDQSVVEVSPGVVRPLAVFVQTKAFGAPLAELILRRTSLRTRGLTNYEARLSLVDRADGSVELLSVSGAKGYLLLSQLPPGYLDWTEGIGPLAVGPRDDASNVRQRSPTLQFRLSSSFGRFEIANLSFECASVARG